MFFASPPSFNLPLHYGLRKKIYICTTFFLEISQRNFFENKKRLAAQKDGDVVLATTIKYSRCASS